MKYGELYQMIRECKSHMELFKVAKDISVNQKQYKLDDYQMDRLEQAGMIRVEQLEREGRHLIKNKRQGFNNFDD